MVANIGDGEKVVAKVDPLDMEESSSSLQQRGKASTKATVSLTPEQALEILQQSIYECRKAGIEIEIIGGIRENEKDWTGMMVANVAYIGGNLVLISGK